MDINKNRCIGLVGHGGTGKTSVGEAMLFCAGENSRLGKVDDGTSILDYEPEELKRKSTISSSFANFKWKKHIVNLIDTPGDFNFFTESKNCMRVVDGAVIFVDASSGLKVQTENAWDIATEYNLPRILFLNKMDKERADFNKTVNELQNTLKPDVVPTVIPIGAENDFKGVIDLIEEKAYIYKKDGSGSFSTESIPDDMADEAASLRENLLEHISESDDTLLEKYLEGEKLTLDEIKNGLAKGVQDALFVPIIAGSALLNIGIPNLMDYINSCIPSPGDRGSIKGKDIKSGEDIERKPSPDEPFSALVFKTISDPYAGKMTVFKIYSGTINSDTSFYNSSKKADERAGQLLKLQGKGQKSVSSAGPGEIVALAKLKDTATGDTLCSEKDPVLYEPPAPIPSQVAMAVYPKTKGDEEKVFGSLAKIVDEDNSLKLIRNDETREHILHGAGQLHLETVMEKIKRKFSVEGELRPPKIPYRETIKGKATIHSRHKKQSGGRGQFADCHIEIEPIPRGSGFEFVNKIVGGAIPRQFIPAVEKGIVETLPSGALAGYQTIDIKVTLFDGAFHTVDSSEMAFKIAASTGFKKAVLDAKPVLLEPILKMEIIVPEENMGDIIGDLNSKRGKVLGMDPSGSKQIIHAMVPQAEVLTYATDLRAMTGGRGIFSTEFDHYEDMPPHLQEKIIADYKASNEE